MSATLCRARRMRGRGGYGSGAGLHGWAPRSFPSIRTRWPAVNHEPHYSSTKQPDSGTCIASPCLVSTRLVSLHIISMDSTGCLPRTRCRLITWVTAITRKSGCSRILTEVRDSTPSSGGRLLATEQSLAESRQATLNGCTFLLTLRSMVQVLAALGRARGCWRGPSSRSQQRKMRGTGR